MIIYDTVVVVVVVGVIVVVDVVVPHPQAATQIRRSNCLDICQSKLACVLCPICLLGIAIFLLCLLVIHSDFK
jgi:hypothetical protein